jgi:hypothetical protein
MKATRASAISHSSCPVRRSNRSCRTRSGPRSTTASPSSPRAPHDAGVRQHAPARRTRRAAPRRTPRRGASDFAPRQSREGASADAEQRLKAGQLRRWSRRLRSSSASTSATSISSASSARRARSPRSCSASAAPATDSSACRRAAVPAVDATSWSSARRCSPASPRRARRDPALRRRARRARAADRRRGEPARMARSTRCSSWCVVPRPIAR